MQASMNREENQATFSGICTSVLLISQLMPKYLQPRLCLSKLRSSYSILMFQNCIEYFHGLLLSLQWHPGSSLMVALGVVEFLEACRVLVTELSMAVVSRP